MNDAYQEQDNESGVMSKYLNYVNPDHYFMLSNGLIIKNLEEMYNVIKNSDDYIFNEHANNEKNDFANWIKYCVFYDALYDKINPIRTKSEFLKILEITINELKNPPKTNIPIPQQKTEPLIQQPTSQEQKIVEPHSVENPVENIPPEPSMEYEEVFKPVLDELTDEILNKDN